MPSYFRFLTRRVGLQSGIESVVSKRGTEWKKSPQRAEKRGRETAVEEAFVKISHPFIRYLPAPAGHENKVLLLFFSFLFSCDQCQTNLFEAANDDVQRKIYARGLRGGRKGPARLFCWSSFLSLSSSVSSGTISPGMVRRTPILRVGWFPALRGRAVGLPEKMARILGLEKVCLTTSFPR